jgi:hypothetical protein
VTRNRACLTLALVCSMACGDDDGPVEVDAGTDAGGALDGGTGAGTDDGGTGDGGSLVDAGTDAGIPPCGTRTQVGIAVGDLSSGDVVYFSEDALPAGDYRINYIGGCMRYSPSQGITVNASESATGPAWFLVEDDREGSRLPGTVGFEVGSGAFATEAECIGASRVLASARIATPVARRLGVRLADTGYGDNSGAAPPTWELESLSGPSGSHLCASSPENVRFPSPGDDGLTEGAAVLGTADGGSGVEGTRTIAHTTVRGIEGLVFFRNSSLTCAPRFRVLVNDRVVTQPNLAGEESSFRWRSSIVGDSFAGPTFTVRYELEAESECGTIEIDVESSTIRFFEEVEIAD